jgi:urea ABC transporter ATP-binding protein UrtD
MILETEDLQKSFNSIVAVDDLNYQMSEGTLECIIGPNGAGKTTFFNLLTGSLRPDGGRIIFDGQNIVGESLEEISQRGIVRKYQTPMVYDELTVRKNLTIAATAGTQDNLHERIKDTLGKIRLTDQQDQEAGTLDHGRKQWLEMGMVLANGPRLMLLDEPTAGMTNEETKQTANLIESMNASGLSIIVIEHDMDFIRDLDSRVTVLQSGSVLAQGDIDEVEADERVQEVYIGGDV